MKTRRSSGSPAVTGSPGSPSLPNSPVPSRQRRWSRWLGAALVAIVVGAAGTILWLRGHPTPRSATGADLGSLARGVAPAELNLVVITLDTTRADNFGAYGSPDVQTPAIDGLAREGVLFEQATTTAPLTLPAHSSIFTGQYPPAHGVRDNGGFFLGPDETTLAEVLSARGFRTGGFIAAYVLDRKWGISQGFDTYVDDFDADQVRGKSIGSIQRPGNEVVDKALPWMDSVRTNRFFAWIHLYDPHLPYAPPEPFKSRCARHPYRGEIAFADAQVGRVVDFLRERGLIERTIVVVLGDHGEGLGDHGEDAHGFFIYESATHVPFVIRAPFALTRGRRVADPVRIVDMMPTVLDLLRVDGPAPIAGATLVPLMTGARRELGLEGYAESMYPLHHYGWSDLRAMRAGRYKVIDAPRPELYDLEQDPGEAVNLFDQRRALGDQMVGRLRQMEQAFEKAAPAQPAVDVDPEVRARLAALGYVGSFVASANDAPSDRADPKDKIDLFNLLAEARDIGAAPGSFARAAAIYNTVVTRDPNVIDAWFSLGNLHFREGQFKSAIGYFKRALTLKPDYDLAVINMAAAFRNLGDDEAALAGFRHYLTIDASDPYVRYQMGEIYLDRGDVAQAEEEFRKALEIDSKVASARNALGVIAFQRGDIDAAERMAQEALAIKATVRLAHYNLALIAERRGQSRLAEKEYLLELEQHPDAYKAAFNLSRLYAQMGDRAGEVDALTQAIEGNPQFAEGHIFLARASLDTGAPLEDAERHARQGLALAPRSEMAPLAHYVLADVYNRRGRRDEAARERDLGRALEGRGTARNR